MFASIYSLFKKNLKFRTNHDFIGSLTISFHSIIIILKQEKKVTANGFIKFQWERKRRNEKKIKQTIRFTLELFFWFKFSSYSKLSSWNQKLSNVKKDFFFRRKKIELKELKNMYVELCKEEEKEEKKNSFTRSMALWIKRARDWKKIGKVKFDRFKNKKKKKNKTKKLTELIEFKFCCL